MNKFFLSLKKWFLFVLLLSLFLAFFYFDFHNYLTLETIKQYQTSIEDWTSKHYFAAVFLYLIIYIGLIACAIPCATFLTLVGGFLFGTIALIYAILGTSLGGLVLYLAVRTSFGASLAAKSTGWIKKIEHRFQNNAFNYILMMRLVPIFPCWLSNISAGVLNIPLKTFMSATLIGIFPATLIYVMVGRGLDKLIVAEPSGIDIIFTPPIFIPLVALAILSLFPVFYKSVKKLRI